MNVVGIVMIYRSNFALIVCLLLPLLTLQICHGVPTMMGDALGQILTTTTCSVIFFRMPPRFIQVILRGDIIC